MKIEYDVSVQRIYFSFGKPKQLSVLKDISFNVKKGEFVSVVGPSGCGKTTLLKIIDGIYGSEEHNHYSLGGRALVRGELPTIAKKRGEIGFVFQAPNLLPWRRAIDNVRLPLEIVKSRKEKFDPYHLLRVVNLAEYANLYPYQLSAGMAKRISLVRSLVHKPSVLLMDEPFASLDELTRENLGMELLELWEKLRPTTLLVTHDLSEAILLSDRVVILSNKPAIVREIVDVNLPKPRKLDMKETVEFNEIKGKIRKILSLD